LTLIKKGRRSGGYGLLARRLVRFVFTWGLEKRRTKQQRWLVRFADEGVGKPTLTFIHHGWDKRPDGAKWRGNYNQDWDRVLGEYAKTVV